MRFATEAETLRAQVARLRQARRPLFLTMEAGALTRWASAIVRPLVERLIICEPRHNRLINSNPTKSDEADVEGMCLLLRLGKLKEVWMGTDRKSTRLNSSHVKISYAVFCLKKKKKKKKEQK